MLYIYKPPAVPKSQVARVLSKGDGGYESTSSGNPVIIVRNNTSMEKPGFRHIVRIANTDLDGQKKLVYALQRVKGVGMSYGHAICSVLHIDETRRIGELTDAECKRIEEAISIPSKFSIPSWLLNRQRDHETGEARHVVGNDLAFCVESDIRLMKKMKCYKGVRHILGLPVRGQRMRSKHRRNKGKVLGVKKPKVGKKQ